MLTKIHSETLFVTHAHQRNSWIDSNQILHISALWPHTVIQLKPYPNWFRDFRTFGGKGRLVCKFWPLPLILALVCNKRIGVISNSLKIPATYIARRNLCSVSWLGSGDIRCSSSVSCSDWCTGVSLWISSASPTSTGFCTWCWRRWRLASPSTSSWSRIDCFCLNVITATVCTWTN